MIFVSSVLMCLPTGWTVADSKGEIPRSLQNTVSSVAKQLAVKSPVIRKISWLSAKPRSVASEHVLDRSDSACADIASCVASILAKCEITRKAMSYLEKTDVIGPLMIRRFERSNVEFNLTPTRSAGPEATYRRWYGVAYQVIGLLSEEQNRQRQTHVSFRVRPDRGINLTSKKVAKTH